MGIRTAMAVLMIVPAGVAHARDESPTARAAGASASNLVQLHLLAHDRAAVRQFRIEASAAPGEPLPGDRPSSELFASNAVDLPREPSARMNARMSMRLDEGPGAMRPAFSLGGIGGAIVRVTDALLDD